MYRRYSGVLTPSLSAVPPPSPKFFIRSLLPVRCLYPTTIGLLVPAAAYLLPHQDPDRPTGLFRYNGAAYIRVRLRPRLPVIAREFFPAVPVGQVLRVCIRVSLAVRVVSLRCRPDVCYLTTVFILYLIFGASDSLPKTSADEKYVPTTFPIL